MHKRVGDILTVLYRFATETVRIRNVYEYPDGGFAYGFYSQFIGRNVLQDCTCAACEPLKKERGARGEMYIGDPKRKTLITLSS